MRLTTIKLETVEESLRSAAEKVGTVRDGWLTIDTARLARLRHPGHPAATVQTIRPADQWPAWALGIAFLKAEADTGVGDTVERIIGPIGGTAFKLWAKSLGIDCGCGARRDSWNRRFPYKPPPGN